MEDSFLIKRFILEWFLKLLENAQNTTSPMARFFGHFWETWATSQLAFFYLVFLVLKKCASSTRINGLYLGEGQPPAPQSAFGKVHLSALRKITYI